ncbi:hypothetical protein PR202_gb07614 [Eleusine coracana subsp. coracana]|uniref:Uncharacterized protein n=1 Tax=Eleusine coracana subsp. coracana TaxID=191504 RepID=A0AAV5EAV8_ELECO|nr:hypothetical protein PR202_gb07614 [Eleusine coracana subsp. coracana]
MAEAAGSGNPRRQISRYHGGGPLGTRGWVDGGDRGKGCYGGGGEREGEDEHCCELWCQCTREATPSARSSFYDPDVVEVEVTTPHAFNYGDALAPDLSSFTSFCCFIARFIL